MFTFAYWFGFATAQLPKHFGFGFSGAVAIIKFLGRYRSHALFSRGKLDTYHIHNIIINLSLLFLCCIRNGQTIRARFIRKWGSFIVHFCWHSTYAVK